MKVLDRSNIAPVAWMERKRAPLAANTEGPLRLDRVSLSQEVVAKQRADAEKVGQIRQALAQGQYKVDLERLAQAFLSKEMP